MTINNNYLYTECPRCHGALIECSPTHDECIRCAPCHLHHSIDIFVIWTFGNVRCKIGDYVVGWFLLDDGNKMTIINRVRVKESGVFTTDVNYTPVVINSWLPFDVSAERIKKLLVFS